MGCGAIDPRQALLRVVRTDTGALDLDGERRAAGRGGYLHVRPECWTRFARRKGAIRSLRASVDRAARAALVAQLERGVGGEG
jgi:predicted RNA-binding protein YlxR (DUF448 family)